MRYMLLVRSATSFAANQQRRSLWFGNGWEWVNGRQQGRKAQQSSPAPHSPTGYWYARLLPLLQTNIGGCYGFAMNGVGELYANEGEKTHCQQRFLFQRRNVCYHKFY